MPSYYSSIIMNSTLLTRVYMFYEMVKEILTESPGGPASPCKREMFQVTWTQGKY